MLKKIMILLFTLPANVFAIQYSVTKAINEVQWIDETNWAIELINTEFYSVNKNCTTDVIRLYIASSKKTYSTLLYFNNDGLAVLKRASITGIPDSQKVSIKQRDTIFIPDPNLGDKMHYPDSGWICVINNPVSGHSLIKTSLSFVESSRSSIGSPGNYETIHNVHVLDKSGIRVPHVKAYRIETAYGSGGIHPSFIFIQSTGQFTNGIPSVTAEIDCPEKLIYLSDRALDSISLPSKILFRQVEFDPVFPTFVCKYNDSIMECNDTLRVAPNFHKVTVVDGIGNPCSSLLSKYQDIPLGKEIGNGVYVFRLFEKESGVPYYPIDFYRSTDTSLMAACTLAYVDTADTLCRTIQIKTSAIAHPVGKYGTWIAPQIQCTLFRRSSGEIGFTITSTRSDKKMSLDIFSFNGKRVATMNIPGTPGKHTVYWSQCTERSKKFSQGNYICTIQSEGNTVLTKCLPVF